MMETCKHPLVGGTGGPAKGTISMTISPSKNTLALYLDRAGSGEHHLLSGAVVPPVLSEIEHFCHGVILCFFFCTEAIVVVML